MKGKVIYVDFKKASRRNSNKKNNHQPINNEYSYMKKIASKFNNMFNKFFRKKPTYNEQLKYKHWL